LINQIFEICDLKSAIIQRFNSFNLLQHFNASTFQQHHLMNRSFDFGSHTRLRSRWQSMWYFNLFLYRSPALSLL